MKRTQAVVLSWWFSCCPAAVLFPSPSSRQQQIEAHARQAAEYLRQNQPDLAVSEFRAIVALDPNNVDARGNLGVVLFFEGSYADAIPELRTTLKMRPTLWKIQALLGIAEKRTGDINAARDDLEKAFPNVSDQKIRIETGMELIEIYSGTGDLDKAAAIVSVLREARTYGRGSSIHRIPALFRSRGRVLAQLIRGGPEFRANASSDGARTSQARGHRECNR